ncbi:aldehyde reductase [Angomonas deanei]|nr:aldehyde reductase [Angomonas deanei]|eukprot:EPY42020.1 aldehyde reductase [Angomonas deanei]
MGDNKSKRSQELEAIRSGVREGMTVIDTAEMYGSGRSESLVGEAITALNREDLFLVSKVLPNNAGRRGIFTSCEESLKRLGTTYLDLYLLHWRGGIPLRETVECMEELVAKGKIRRWGVSNFDIDDMKELWSVPNGDHCAVNQVLYHVGSRGIEYSLLPWMKEHHVAAMAYCPLAQAGELNSNIYTNKTLQKIAADKQITMSQLLLAFVVRHGNVMAIPKAGNAAHAKENAKAGDISISDEEWKEVDKAFPPPNQKEHLDIV